MKTAVIIVLAILCIASLLLNVWFYTETSNLDDTVSRQLGRGYSTTFELPTDTISRLKSNFTQLVSANQQLQQQYEATAQECSRLRSENRQYEATLAQIKREAEQAQKLQIFGGLLSLILGLF